MVVMLSPPQEAACMLDVIRLHPRKKSGIVIGTMHEEREDEDDEEERD